MEQVLKLYVCGLSTVTDRDALYSCHYFFNEGELVVICDECLLFLFFPFFFIIFSIMFLFQSIKKMFNRNVYNTKRNTLLTDLIRKLYLLRADKKNL